MTITPHLRRATLTAHIMSSVGWFGGVAGFLALSISGLTSGNPQVVRSSYIGMEMIGWFVIVPFCLASLATGLVQSLVTPWGLFRHNWIVAKLVIALLATILLTLHMRPVAYVASVAAAATTLSAVDLRQMRIQLVADAVLAMLALTTATTLSVFKPPGLTPYGRRIHAERGLLTVADESFPWTYVWGIGALLLVLLFIFVHFAGLALHGHHP